MYVSINMWLRLSGLGCIGEIGQLVGRELYRGVRAECLVRELGLGESSAREDGVGEGGGAGSAQRSSPEEEETAGDSWIREGVGEGSSAASAQVSLECEPTGGPMCLGVEGDIVSSSVVTVVWALVAPVFELVVSGVIAALAAGVVVGVAVVFVGEGG